MAGITAEGKLWIDLVDVYTWLTSRGTNMEEALGIRFDIERDALVLVRDGKDFVEIEASEFWTWVNDKHLPSGLACFETAFGVPEVKGPDLVVSFAVSSDGDPRNWDVLPICLAEWKRGSKINE